VHNRATFWAGLPAIVLALWPATGLTDAVPVTIVQDRVYRLGVFLAVDALVENSGEQPIDQVEVSVELYNHFDQLLSVEYTQLRPFTVGPGQTATLRVLTPYTDGVRNLRYRFTWRQGETQLQYVAKRDVWTIGQATRDP
jgi:hypothetical protein